MSLYLILLSEPHAMKHTLWETLSSVPYLFVLAKVTGPLIIILSCLSTIATSFQSFLH